MEGIGFRAMMIGIAIICFLYGPLLYFLKDPKPRTEQEKQETSVSHAMPKDLFGSDQRSLGLLC